MKDNRLYIRLSNLLKSEIEQIVFDIYWKENKDMTVSTFVRQAIIREIKRIRRNEKNKNK